MKEYLDSDRLNFLIWRYLLESNYRESAASLQKDWQKSEPHRNFDFAPHVHNHALVHLVNRGLEYYALERQFKQSQLPQDGPAAMAAAVEGSQTGVFGPLIARPPQEEEEEPVMETDVNSGELSRKRPVPGSDGAQAPVNGSQPKRPRLSNGYENGVDAATPMDIDHPQGENNNHAYPSPFEGEQAQTPAPRTDGPEQATQIDKVTELATETTYILLSDDGDASTAATALSSSAASGPASDGAAVGASASTASSRGLPILLNCEWSPREAPVLAAVGTDALARVWNTSRVTSADPVPNHVNGSIVGNLIPDDVTEATLFTSLAWNADGTAIAVASETGRQAKISIWDNTCNYIQGFVLNESPVIKLKWNPDNASVLSISPENKDILITVLQTVTGVQISHVLKSLESTEPTELDAAWVDTNEFLICGGEVLKCFKCSENSIFESRKFETREEEGFSQVLFDARSNLAATASDKGCIDIWDGNGMRRTISAHLGPITALEWQPLPNTQPLLPDDERLIASGGDDGAIVLRDARHPDAKARNPMTMGLPIVAMSFTPDGAFIAGATADRILIWKVGEGIPRASWSRQPHPGWLSPRPSANATNANASSDGEEEDQHCLKWDSTGQRLAYGVNSRLAIINFR